MSTSSQDESSTREELTRWVLDRPAEIFAVLAAVPTLFYGLGLMTQSSRESLIQLGVPLSYAHQNAILVSLDVLWSLPWHALTALLVGGGVAAAAWTFVILQIASFSLVKIGAPAWARWAWFAFVALLLFLAVTYFRTALYPTHVPGGVGADFEAIAGAAVADQIEVEVVSWLRNDSELNAVRRAGLAGLYVWLLTTLIVHLVLLLRQPKAWPPLKRAFVTVFSLLAALIITDVPRAHAIAAWGVAYPTVQVRPGKTCDPALQAALASKSCCGYDVSAGGIPRVTLLLGEGCPNGEGFRTWSEKKSHCLTTGARRVIDAEDC